MNVDRAVMAFAGLMILLSVWLAYAVSPWWLLFTGFIGLNMLQSAFTGFCPAAMIGFPIALSGTIGFIATGLRETGLPPYSVGFVYLPALAGIVVLSMLMAPVGAAAAHRLPTLWLKRIFAVLFYIMATRMLFTFV